MELCQLWPLRPVPGPLDGGWKAVHVIAKYGLDAALVGNISEWNPLTLGPTPDVQKFLSLREGKGA